ncbi:unnamed protein product [Cladocopium goreaui]|uniref:Uncharacterized protein n=1 Tax=Cladocopium goreaui TaxID=2562237 RepID=A0A9P1BKC4_9DINO|nr:unnamed protein product [Cladocopium goreaui]
MAALKAFTTIWETLQERHMQHRQSLAEGVATESSNGQQSAPAELKNDQCQALGKEAPQPVELKAEESSVMICWVMTVDPIVATESSNGQQSAPAVDAESLYVHKSAHEELKNDQCQALGKEILKNLRLEKAIEVLTEEKKEIMHDSVANVEIYLQQVIEKQMGKLQVLVLVRVHGLRTARALQL